MSTPLDVWVFVNYYSDFVNCSPFLSRGWNDSSLLVRGYCARCHLWITFLLLLPKTKISRTDISISTSYPTVPLQEDVEGHGIGTPPAVRFPSKGGWRSYGIFPFWREVPVFMPYRSKAKAGSKSGSTAGTGELISIVPESVAAPNPSLHGKLTHFLLSELNGNNYKNWNSTDFHFILLFCQNVQNRNAAYRGRAGLLAQHCAYCCSVWDDLL